MTTRHRFIFLCFHMWQAWFKGVGFVLLSIGVVSMLLMVSPLTVRAASYASASAEVLTYKNDTLRTGANTQETTLNTTNVNASQFGKRVTYPVDGRIYGQPLFVPHVQIGGTQHNVVFVATEHDSVYAFDADVWSSKPGSPLWKTSFLTSSSVVPISNNDVYCADLGGTDAGLTGTPVIDQSTNTLYVVAATKENGKFFSRLHALDITTGQEKPNSPVTITATVKGTGMDSSKGQITFNPLRENQRAGLLLSGGVVYIAWVRIVIILLITAG